MDTSRESLTRLYEQVTSSLDELFGMLGPADWSRPTDCPAWTVKDIVAHLSSLEAIGAGLAEHAADVDVSAHPHATGFNEPIERDIEARRGWEPARLVSEFRDATLKRAETLRGMDDETFDTGSTTMPFGPMPTKDLVPIRLIDLYFHEQDLRRATGHPGHLDGDVARFCFERIKLGLPVILGKRVGLSEGQTVVLNLTSHAGTTLAYGVNAEGRVEALSEAPAEPTVRIACDLEHFLMLTGGRGDPKAHVASGAVTLTGDRVLGEKILEQLSVTP